MMTMKNLWLLQIMLVMLDVRHHYLSIFCFRCTNIIYLKFSILVFVTLFFTAFIDLACSSAFWKKMEPIFAPVSSKDKIYLSQQVGTVFFNNVLDYFRQSVSILNV